jgi:hypothetical protein
MASAVARPPFARSGGGDHLADRELFRVGAEKVDREVVRGEEQRPPAVFHLEHVEAVDVPRGGAFLPDALGDGARSNWPADNGDDEAAGMPKSSETPRVTPSDAHVPDLVG